MRAAFKSLDIEDKTEEWTNSKEKLAVEVELANI